MPSQFVQALVLGGAIAAAQPPQPTTLGDPQLDYLLHCGGCHGPAGQGAPKQGIPRLAGEVAKLLHVPSGRLYIMQVPGVSNNSLDNAKTAELLNWLVAHFDAADMPADFVPFTEEELATYRQQGGGAVLERRAGVAAALKDEGIILGSYDP